MRTDQLSKFVKWLNQDRFAVVPEEIFNAYETGWQACLEANGIGEDVKGKDDESAAPQWVLDMMRTGKPVRCNVWDDDEDDMREATVIGYCLPDNEEDGDEYIYATSGGVFWRKAEPIPAWKPQDGEAVLFCDDDNHGRAMAGFIRNGILYARGLMCADWEKREKVKPFDASKIGKPWSEI